MGPTENLTGPRKRQAGGRRKQSGRRPRQRYCLLKGCEQRFHPRQARQRYCSQECREAARKWLRWKDQQRYRKTAAGRQKRNGQGRRYRERVKSRKPPEPEAVDDAARVTTNALFFRAHLRPAWVLRAIPATAAKSVAAVLLRGMPTGTGAGPAAGAALETGADLIQTY
jgi:Bacteriophage Lambda NinG protein